MAEEQRYQEGHHRPCANSCGFFGSPTTLNLCSKCYRDLHASSSSPSSPSSKAGIGKSLVSSSSTAAVSSLAAGTLIEPTSPPAAEALSVAQQQRPNRCAACRKRVGPAGFRCRCGATFCGVHRYPERHGCGFDYKAAGRDAIARANPAVKADKLHRI